MLINRKSTVEKGEVGMYNPRTIVPNLMKNPDDCPNPGAFDPKQQLKICVN